MSHAGHTKNFKSVIVKVTDEQKRAAKIALVRNDRKPTLRNVAKLLREWAARGIADRSRGEL